MAEGAVSIMIVSTLGVLMLLLLLDGFLTMYYRSKVQFIALETAQFLANLPKDANLQEETERHADDLLKKMGMSLKSIPQCERQGDYATVTVAANPPALLGSSDLFLPVLLELTDTEISTPQSNKAVGWLRLEFRNDVYGPGDPKPGGADLPIYLPILSQAQTDTTKRNYMMLDTAYWPKTHVVYHAVHDGFPDNPGATGGSFAESTGTTLSSNPFLTSQFDGMSGFLESVLAVYPPSLSGSSMFPYPPSIAQQKINQCLNLSAMPNPMPCGFYWVNGVWHFEPDPAQAQIRARQPDRFRESLPY